MLIVALREIREDGKRRKWSASGDRVCNPRPTDAAATPYVPAVKRDTEGPPQWNELQGLWLREKHRHVIFCVTVGLRSGMNTYTNCLYLQKETLKE